MKKHTFSKQELNKYLRLYPDATEDEIAAVIEWMAAGHSPYDNSLYMSNDRGDPLNYIEAIRSLPYMRQAYEHEHEQQDSSSNIMDNSDLPF